MITAQDEPAYVRSNAEARAQVLALALHAYRGCWDANACEVYGVAWQRGVYGGFHDALTRAIRLLTTSDEHSDNVFDRAGDQFGDHEAVARILTAAADEDWCDVCRLAYVPEDSCHACLADWRRPHDEYCPHA